LDIVEFGFAYECFPEQISLGKYPFVEGDVLMPFQRVVFVHQM
jgi:hypothetical protein